MSLFEKIRGIIGGYLQLDNTNTAHGIAENSNGIEARTNNNAARSNFVSAQASSDDQCTNRLDLKQRSVLLEFNFPGLTPPVIPPLNGTYGICTSNGGIYVSGRIYQSDGAGNYATIYTYKMQTVFNVIAFSDAFSMIADGYYIAETNSSPYNWTLIGTGPVGPPGPPGPTGSVLAHSYVDMIASGSSALVDDNRDITFGATFGVFGLIGETVIISGVRFYAKYTSYPRTIRVSVWDNSGIRQATEDVVVNVEGVVNAIFTTSWSVPATQYQRYLNVGMWDTSASKSMDKYSGWPGFIFTGPFIASERRIDYGNSWYEFGDNNPTNNSGGTYYPIEPIVSIFVP